MIFHILYFFKFTYSLLRMKRALQILTLKGMIKSELHLLPIKNKI